MPFKQLDNVIRNNYTNKNEFDKNILQQNLNKIQIYNNIEILGNKIITFDEKKRLDLK